METLNNMKTYDILGYTNPINCFPAPITTIVRNEDKICALFPDLTLSKLNIEEHEQLKSLSTFIAEKKNRKINSNEYSYMNHKGKIIINTPEKMIHEMKNDLTYISNNPVHHELLSELIFSELLNLNIKESSSLFSKIMPLVSASAGLRIIVTVRIKNNGDKAKRIILQHTKNGSYKTDYRKNLYTNEELTNHNTSRFITELTNTLENIAKSHKNYFLLNNILKIKEWVRAINQRGYGGFLDGYQSRMALT
jgi:hypothetical protein